jgi:hypothetical protein
VRSLLTTIPCRRTGILLVAVAVALSSCAESSSGEPPPEPTSDVQVEPSVSGEFESTPEALGALDDRIGELLALPEADRRTELADLGLTLQAELAGLSGLTDELGGEASMTAALQQAWLPTIESTLALETTPLQFGFASAPAPAVDTGEGLFGGYMTVALLLGDGVRSTNGSTDAEMVERSGSVPGNPKIEVHSSRGNVGGALEGEETANGVTTKLSVKYDVVACPDKDGNFDGTAHLDVSVSKGAVGQRTTLDITLKGAISDNADIASLDIGFRAQAGRSSGGRGEFIDVSGAAGLGSSPGGVKVNRSGGTVSPGLSSSAEATGSLYGLMIGALMYQAAETGWKSGRCVQLDATAAPGPTGLEPGSTSAITATPTSKLDGTATGGKVTATLSAGGAGVSPTTPVPAVAAFTYQAPDESGKGGTVSLESRSKRGVGKAAIDFDTKQLGYLATYDGGGISITGTISDLSTAFETVGVFTGGSAHFHHIPADATAGSINFNDPCGPGCVFKGNGTYAIVDNGDGTLTMNESLSACTTVTAGFTQETCQNKAHAVRLTPIV